MAMTDALSIYLENGTTKAYLKNVLAGIFENYQKEALSARFKSKNANLNRAAGSYEFKRFANSTVRDYGTARTAGKGDKIIAPPITVNLDKNKEIVEEVNFFDADGSFTDEGFKAMVERRKTNFELSVTDFLDLDFFSVAKAGGTAATALGVTDLDSTKSFKRQIETLIGKFEKTGKNGTENKYVRGIDRRYMALILDSSLYGLVKDELNDCRNFSQMISDEKFTGINGVACFSSVNLPDGVDYELMTMDSIAQPVLPSGFEFEKIPLSIEYAMEMFFRYGSKVLAPELVLHGKLAADAA
ncbi:MAG: hypothetical protein ACLR3U_12020 [Christensenellaceae bacterium]|jgi:hypothetical protein|nr:MAG TPA: major capsid protein [Caudoviricetes sp.]